MKTWQEVVESLAQDRFHAYIGGSKDFRLQPVAFAAAVYGVSVLEAQRAVELEFQRLLGSPSKE